MKITYLTLRKIGPFSPLVQSICIVTLYILTTLLFYLSLQKTGALFGIPTFLYSGVLFAPIYEEVIFRGILLSTVEHAAGTKKAVIFSSLLFGFWHLKNIVYLLPPNAIQQMAYTGLIFGPLMAIITLKTKSIGPAIIVHYSNNLILFASTFFFALH